jgi:predicted HicB family RNase H-like nuclease
MSTRPNEFVTVHMRGLKTTLVAHAASQRISVSVLVRRAVERELGLVGAQTGPEPAAQVRASAAPVVKLSIRFPSSDAEQLKEGARQAGLSHAAFISALLTQARSATGDPCSHRERVSALTSSCAELSVLARNVDRLSALLRHGEVEAAQEYRRMLDMLADDVRAHLRLAAAALAALQPVRRVGSQPEPRSPREPSTHH